MQIVPAPPTFAPAPPRDVIEPVKRLLLIFATLIAMRPPPPPPPNGKSPDPPFAEIKPAPVSLLGEIHRLPPEPPPHACALPASPSALNTPSTASVPFTIKRNAPPPAPPCNDWSGALPPPPLPRVVGLVSVPYTVPPKALLEPFPP